MKIKYIFFDVGGIFVRFKGAPRKIANQLHISEEKTIAFFDKNTDEIDKGKLSWNRFEALFYETFQPKYHLNCSLVESFVNNFEIIQEMHDFAYEISKTVAVGILSNNSSDVFRLEQENKLLPDIPFISTVLSFEIELIKPQKEIFEYAVNSIQVLPQNILLIDDTQTNVEVAESLGWKTCLFDTKNPAKSISQMKTDFFPQSRLL